MTTQPPPRQEIHSLTSLRGFLAVWVVMYHYWNDVLRLFPASDVLSPLIRLGHMAVPAFFILSGFVLAYNYAPRFQILERQGVSRFLWLRFIRIYPVHLVTLLAVGLMVLVSERLGYQLTDAGYTRQDFILNLFLVQTWVPYFQLNWNYPSWSISSEWFAYLLFPFAVCLLQHRITSAVRAVFFGAAALLGSIAVMLFWQPWPFYELILVVPTFFSGVAAYYLTGFSRSLPNWRYLPELIVVTIVGSCYSGSIAVVIAVLLCCFVTLVFVLALLGDRCHGVWNASAALFLGEVSYSLYMTHTLAQKFVYRVLPSARFEQADVFTRIGVLLAYLGFVLACCLLTFYFIERPCRQMLKKSASNRERTKMPSESREAIAL